MDKKFLGVIILCLLISNNIFSQGGVSYNSAVKAKVGVNISDNSLGSQWYKYVAKANGEIILNSCGLTRENTNVEVFVKGEDKPFASNDDFIGGQSKLRVKVFSGKTYLIKWGNYFTDKRFNWTLKFQNIQRGDFCDFPINLNNKLYSTTISQAESKWFRYKAPKNGKLTVKVLGNNADNYSVSIFNSNDKISVKNENLNRNYNISVVDAKEGEYYLIYIHNLGKKSTVKLSLAVSQWEAGERCQDAIDVDEIVECKVSHKSGTSKWYKYVADDDTKITISTVDLTSQDTYLEIYKGGCNKSLRAFNDDSGNGLQSKIDIQTHAGDVYYIKWSNIFNPKDYAYSLKSKAISTEIDDADTIKLSVYPNPSKGFIKIDLSTFADTEVLCKVYNLSSAMVDSFYMQGGSVVGKDLSKLQKGIYILLVENETVKKTVKLIIN